MSSRSNCKPCHAAHSALPPHGLATPAGSPIFPCFVKVAKKHFCFPSAADPCQPFRLCDRPRCIGSSYLQLFFSATLFLSAALLFLVQPMIAKMVLPLLGGTPAVWNTCMVFFQAVLLAGYAYAHGLPGRMGVHRHAAFHLILLLMPFLVL